MPPFFTWSFKSAKAAVVPGAPAYSNPISSKISATESPIAGVGANDKSIIPKGIPILRLASCATNCPTLVILKAVFLMVSHNTSKLSPRTCSNAFFTTPGPETPTLMMASASVTPWNAPAINGLSSGALQKTTSLAHPRESFSLVDSAVFSMISPISLTASILMPALVDPTLTELHTRSVSESAWGMERIKLSSPAVIPLDTRAEYPPIKLTPTSLAARSKVLASDAKSSEFLHAACPIKAIGVTEIRLLTIGMQ